MTTPPFSRRTIRFGPNFCSPNISPILMPSRRKISDASSRLAGSWSALPRSREIRTAAHWICQVFDDYVGRGTAGLHIAASENHGTHSLHQLSQLVRRERARRPQDDRLMNGDESVGKSHARPIDATA
jgi:hypothetical protein